ncbi:UNVERIFIED_CONTAM: hypothetical protein K2H54_057159 [Gekko kuhli]
MRKARNQMRMDKFLEERVEEVEPRKEAELFMDINTSRQEANQWQPPMVDDLLQRKESTLGNEADLQLGSRSPRAQSDTDHPLNKVNYESIILKQTSLISETLLSLYTKIGLKKHEITEIMLQ